MARRASGAPDFVFCSRALHTALVKDLVAAIRATEGLLPQVRAERLRARLDAAGRGASLDEMLTVAERARLSHASDDELGLALGLVIALSRREGGEAR